MNSAAVLVPHEGTDTADRDTASGRGAPSGAQEQSSLGRDGAWDAIVLGAGISGLVSASILSKGRRSRTLVIDEYERVGGNHIDVCLPPYTFDIGAIIFQDDSPLLAHFPELLPHYHPINYSIGRVTPDSRVHAYPFAFQEELLKAGPAEWLWIFGSILFWRLRGRRIGSTLDYARFWMGDRLLRRSGLEHYIERFCGIPAAQLDRSFAEKRMYWIADAASVRKRLARLVGRRESWDDRRSFVRPRAGFAALYAVARTRLEAAGVQFSLGSNLVAVEKTSDGFLVRTEAGQARAARLLSTIPLSRTLQLCGLPEAGPLPPLELISLFFSFAGDRGFRQNILYNFSLTGRWKRLTMFSDFYGQAQGRSFFGVEINARAVDGPDVDIVQAAYDDFVSDVRAKGLLLGDLRLEGAHRLTNAYPSYPAGTVEAVARGIDALRAFGVESFGRQGRFDYLPTARHATLAAEGALASRRPG